MQTKTLKKVNKNREQVRIAVESVRGGARCTLTMDSSRNFRLP